MSESQDKFDIAEKISKSREIKPASLNTYVSSLKQICNDLTGCKDIKSLDFLKDFDNVIKSINKLPKITTRKNRLTSIIVALSIDKEKNSDLINKYSEELNRLADSYMSFLNEQKKTESQEKNWVSYKGLIKIQNDIKDSLKRRNILTKKPEDLTNKEFNKLQQWVIYSTYLKHPLRNDFADMKVIKINDFEKLSDKEKDDYNYLVLYPKNKKEFHINQFKNKESLGKKVLNIDPDLNRIINVWLKFNKSGWYFVKNDRKTPMNPNSTTKFLHSISNKYANGKKIGSSLIRHIVISEVLKDKPTIKEQEKEAKEIEDKFMHSKNMNGLYRKVD